MTNMISEDLQHQGFARVLGVFSASDLRRASDVVDELIAHWHTSHDDEDFWFYTDPLGNEILYRIHHLERKHSAFEELTHHTSFVKLVNSVIPGTATATACALIYKMPLVGAANPWHRDPIDVPACTVFNFSIFLDRSTSENGSISFVPGSHQNTRDFRAGRPLDAVTVCAEVGDVVVHDVRVYHGSEKSTSVTQRRSIILEFQPQRLQPQPIFPPTRG